jgi:hypothetical protein
MLAITHAQPFGACATPGGDALFKKLTGIKVVGAQIISDEDARGISDELVSTVRCNAEEAAKKVIVPAVIVAGVTAIGAGVMLLITMRHRPEALGRATRRRRRR